MKKRRTLTRIIITALIAALLTACGGAPAPAQPAAPQAAKEAAEALAEASAKEAEAAPAETAEPAAEEAAPEDTAAPEAEAPQEAESEAAPEFAAEGEYVLFGVTNEGYSVAAAELGMESSLVLNADGTGSMKMGDEEMPVTEWSLTEDVAAITMEDGSSASGVLRDGIFELDIYGTGEMLMLFSQEGADISGYELLTREELMAKMQEAQEAAPVSLVRSLLDTFDPESGVHLNYQLKTEYLDSEQDFDVQGRGGQFYSSRITRVAGVEDTTVTFVDDGKVYNLFPEKKTGVLVTETSSLSSNALMMDPLFAAIVSKAQSSDFTTETREIDGRTCTAECYPATQYQPESVFVFDGNNALVSYTEGAPVVETAVKIGESFYTVNAIDGAIDESLFDISGYAIQ